MTIFNTEWIYEGPDFSVGIFGEIIHHELCPIDWGDDFFEAEELDGSQTTEGDWVIITRVFKCPKCGKTTSVEEKEPREHFDPPTN